MSSLIIYAELGPHLGLTKHSFLALFHISLPSNITYVVEGDPSEFLDVPATTREHAT